MEFDLTTPPCPGRPTEEQLREYFGRLLPDNAQLMRPPYTTLWALEDGTLLWSEKEGYADLSVKPINYIPDVVRVPQPSLKQVIYMTGPPNSGKSTLIALMQNAVELDKAQFIGFTDLNRTIAKYADNHRTIVITNNSTTPSAFDLSNALRIWCRERKFKYYHINLTTT